MTTVPRCRHLAIFLQVWGLLVLPAHVIAETFHNPSRDTLRFGTSGSTLAYVVLGDSTAAGQGAPYENGIAVLTARELAKTRTVMLTNLAISGARTRDILAVQLPAAERLRPDLVLI